ncbi:MAG: DNA mismatch repair protein MutS [Pyrinomonadaceae bacterium]|nr:DNA mismatch repair protein MutS [Pyrinomonadaceae bacterium]
MDANNATPMLRQYHELKQKYPGTILLFRCGDFYEMFYDDAVLSARELDITLTARGKTSGNPVPMCGVPHHAATGYISKLVRKGYRVAVCEQVETVSDNKKLIRREVARVITPGTAIDEQLLENKDSIYLAAIVGAGSSFAAAFLDLSTGEFLVTQCDGKDCWEQIRADVESFAPREIIYPESLSALIYEVQSPQSKVQSPKSNEYSPKSQVPSPKSDNVLSFPDSDTKSNFAATLTPLDDWLFQSDYCEGLLKTQLGVKELTAFGLDGKQTAICAAGACLRYVQETQRAAAAHITDVMFFAANDFMVLDGVTLRNLEIVESQTGENKRRSLFGVIDATVTNMGSRLLKSWLLRPSVKRGEIESRSNAVEELCESMTRDKLRTCLKDVADLERLIGRLNMNSASPRDLLALRRSLSQIPRVRELLADANASLLFILSENLFELPHIKDLIERAISENPPVNFADGGAICDGYNDELDELRALSKDAKQTIAAFEEAEKRRSGIANLKVRFNGVFGYYIEISKSGLTRVPEDYERRQTLVNAERFTTPQLKEWETKILGAEERMGTLETDIFQKVRSEVTAETRNLQTTARALATLDALAALAETGCKRNYVKPVIHDGDEINIKDGRHAVVEAFLNAPFIPNDAYLNNSTDRLLIITGPNMGGKSTSLRQIAVIQILAQIGGFVPATSARLPIVDRVWTRVGAADDLAGGRSTFMVEMTETATILHNATPKSLILLDEIGRGTSTFDGLSIAWAVAEYLHDSPRHAAKTLFATHYHELTELAERLAGAKNYQITASQRDDEIIFLHKLVKGKATQSFGIAVAQLAGLPYEVLTRAREVLQRLERYEIDVFDDAETTKAATVNTNDALNNAVRKAARGKMAMQTTLFQTANESLLEELRNIDFAELSHEKAVSVIMDLQKKIV